MLALEQLQAADGAYNPRGFGCFSLSAPLLQPGREFYRQRMLRMMAVGALLLVAVGPHQAPRPPSEHRTVDGRWIAYSRTAASITGDIWLSPTLLRMTNVELPVRVVGGIPDFDVHGMPEVVQIRALAQPNNPKLLNGNRWCSKPARWLVFWHWQEGLAMAVFDDARMLTSHDGRGSCGIFYYERPSTS